MNLSLIITAVIVILVILIIISIITMYNSLVRLKQQVKEAFATMDVYLKKRYDLIPNLVETVKGYASHEKSTLENVTAARSAITTVPKGDIKERLAKEGQLSQCLRSLFAVSENYPDLKANSNFLGLQNQLNAIEDDIASSRKYYNAVVKNYNTAILVFPKNIIAKIFNFKEETMYEITNTLERENVKVQF